MEHLDVFGVELIVPVPDVQHHVTTWLGTGYTVGTRNARVNKVAEQAKRDAVPDRCQVDFSEFERRRKLLQQLPRTIKKQKKYRSLKHRYNTGAKNRLSWLRYKTCLWKIEIQDKYLHKAAHMLLIKLA